MSILDNLKQKDYYSYEQVDKFINRLTSIPLREDSMTGVNYVNVPCAFDTETSSFRTVQGEKHCTLYLWQYCHGGINIYGRSIDQFIELLNRIKGKYRLSPMDRRMIIFVHNLAYDFGYLYPHLNVIDMFATKKREPLKVLTDMGIEFRCSARLSGCKLSVLTEEIYLLNIRKLTENIDYRAIYTSNSKIPTRIIEYGINDVRIVSAYIYQKMCENDNDITKLVLTKTGEVRRFMRKKCLGGKNKRRYANLMKQLTMEDAEYKQLKKLFTGGFVHAYLFHSGVTQYNVDSHDISSDYPTRMVAEKYPMSKGVYYEKPEKGFIKYCLEHKCCQFKAHFTELTATGFVSFISESKLISEDSKEVCSENGRVLYAKECSLIMCEMDYRAYKLLYEWKDITISDMWVYDKQYLPSEFVEGILELYQKKTELKKKHYDSYAEKALYQNSKGMLNSSYGMCVFDPVTEDVEYDNGWIDEVLTMTPEQIVEKQEKRIHEKILEYNNDRNRFLFYAWGCWCTAYARYEIAKLVYMTAGFREINYKNSAEYNLTDVKLTNSQNDYTYCDTDCIKAKNGQKYKPYIECYNRWVTNKIRKALEYHNIPFELSQPKNNGEVKPLGVLEHEAHYDRFKALRCKSYLCEIDGEISATVSGIDDKKLIKYMNELVDKYNKSHRKQIDIFDVFSDGLEVPAEKTGKLTHTYIEEPMEGIIRDSNGELQEYHELAGVHLEPASFKISLAQAYVDILEQFLCGTDCREYWEM